MGDGEQRRHRLDRDAEALGHFVGAQPFGFEVQRQLVGRRQPRRTFTKVHERDGTNRAAGCLA